MRLTVNQSIRKEFAEKLTWLVNTNHGGSLTDAFAFYDADQDGRLNRAELEAVLVDAGIEGRLERALWASEVVRVLDDDRDGMVSWSELSKAIHG